MAITVAAENAVSAAKDKHSGPKEEDSAAELILDGGFVTPDANSFGVAFRNYDAKTDRHDIVETTYRLQHINQTYEYALRKREEYSVLNRAVMGIWEACELLHEFVDESDPDLDEPQIEHLLQTAEAIRMDYPNDDWLHLTALIHDLGKVLYHNNFGKLPQWSVVGDTFPVGCAFDPAVVHYNHFKDNPDFSNPKYNTKYGIYWEKCGLENIVMSFGHDEYMYLVSKLNKTTLPPPALGILRFHSFYALHTEGAYTHLLNDEEDQETLKWLKIFTNYDLYSKSKVRIDVDAVKPYYVSLIQKYFPEKLYW